MSLPFRRVRRVVLASAPLLALLLACGVGVPEDKQLYVGEWDSENVSLRIKADGTVLYERTGGVGEVKIRGPIQEWRGEDFAVGLPLLNTTFEVQQPPWLEGGRWHMVVDGVRLVRTGDPFASRSSEVGRPKVEILDVGVFGRERSDGSRGLVQSTSRIPAAVGRSFGAMFAFHEPSETSRVLTFRWDFPDLRNPATGEVQNQLVIHYATAPGGPHWVSADFSDPWDLVAGDWTLRVFDGEQLLAQRSFDVYVP